MVNGTAQWCNVCGETEDRGCAALTLAAQQAHSAALSPLNPIGAGFLGAGVSIAVFGLALGALAFLGLLTFKRSPAKRRRSDTDDEVSCAEKYISLLIPAFARSNSTRGSTPTVQRRQVSGKESD